MTLTTMLVMYTLFSQVSSGLPDTAYIKMLDMWFFFCIFLILSIIVLHVTVEHLQEGSAASKPSKSPPLPKSVAKFASVVKVRPVFSKALDYSAQTSCQSK